MRILISILGCILTTVLTGQSDTLVGKTTDLPSVLVTDSLLTKSITPLTATLTPEAIPELSMRNVADALSQHGEVFIKSYGIGSLATVSVQGGSASQVAVQWNGVPLQSPMLGLTDLALLPNMGLQNLTLQVGGQSATSGSGGISGGIYLQTAKPEGPPSAAYHVRVGSFGYQQHQASISGGRDKWRLRIDGQHLQATNDFPYQIRPDLPVRRQTHAELAQQVLQQALFLELAPRHSLQYFGWQQQSRRNLPPTSAQTRSDARQADAAQRHLLVWQARTQKAIWESRLAYNRERIHYEDPRQGIDSPSRFQSYFLQVKHIRNVTERLRRTTGGQWMQSMADISNYRGTRHLSQVGIYQQWHYDYAHGQWEGAARLESNDFDILIPVFNLAVNHRLGQQAQIAVGGGRDFRTPSLNDLYWIPGGNPVLQPELAWSQFAALEGTWQLGLHQLQLRAQAFNRTVDNWIQWAQQDGDPFWSAGNVAKVWSRGIEPRLTWGHPLGRGHLLLSAQYFYTRSTHQTAVQNPAISKGSQLWYTPVHRTASSLTYRRGTAALRITHQYIGETLGTLDILPAWHWTQVVLNSTHHGKKLTIEWHAELNNVLNENYRVIERRPMPGRHGAIGVKIRIHK